jgi:hypothetical protein
MKNFFLFLFSIVLLSGCQKEIDVDLNSANPQYVIQANLEANKSIVVKISKSLNFSDSKSFPTIENANIVLEDSNGNSETISHSSNGEYIGTRILGTIGTTYTLKINVDNNFFQASSTIFPLTKLDSIKFIESAFGNFGGSDTINYFAIPVFTDPPRVRNFYKFDITVNGKTDPTISVSNDNIIDGKRNEQPIFISNDDYRINKNDIVTIKAKAIDETIYNYYFVLSNLSGDGPGGGSTPTNPVSNFSGGALGYFSAFSSQEISGIAPNR